MNKALIYALMTGSHRHRYVDDSGVCAACHRVHSPHTYQDGVCTVCGFAGCEHPNGFRDNGSATTHICPICGATQEHSYSFAHNVYCRICTVCGDKIPHVFPDRDAESCGTCSVCGDTRASHDWDSSTGKCRYCTYQCLHPQGLDDQDICPVCGKHVYLEDERYRVLSGTYAGSYVYGGLVNRQSYYRQYVLQDGEFQTGSYQLVRLNITTPTQFGGSYAYTATGFVFTTSAADLPINSTLLEGDGRYNIELKQYDLDGKLLAEGSYTSPDCEDLELIEN